MSSTSTQRTGLVALIVGLAACLIWAMWAWSPAREVLPRDDVSAAPPAAPLAPSAAAPAQPPQQPAPQAVVIPPPAAAPDVPVAQPDEAPAERPARIPTPHLMSLDQTKPPEPYGAVAELKHRYASESRSGSSAQTEAKLRELVTVPNISRELVQDISCHRTVCKIEAHWTKRRRIGFSVLVESFKQLYDKRVAVEPAVEASADDTYVTTVYVQHTR